MTTCVRHRSAPVDDESLARVCVGCSEASGAPVPWPCQGRLREVAEASIEEHVARRRLMPTEVDIRRRITVGTEVEGLEGLAWRQCHGGVVIGWVQEEEERVFTILGWGTNQVPYIAQLPEHDVEPAGVHLPNPSFLRADADRLARYAVENGGSNDWVLRCYEIAADLLRCAV